MSERDRMDDLIRALGRLSDIISNTNGIGGGPGGGGGGGGGIGRPAPAAPTDNSGDFGTQPGAIDGAATTSSFASSRSSNAFYRQGQTMAGSMQQYAAQAVHIASGMSGGFSAAVEAMQDAGVSGRSIGIGVYGGVKASEKVVGGWSSAKAEAFEHVGDTSSMQQMRKKYADYRADVSAEESRDYYSGLDALESVLNPEEYARRHSEFAKRRTQATFQEQRQLGAVEGTNNEVAGILNGLARAGGFNDNNPAQAANIKMANNIMGIVQQFNQGHEKMISLIQQGVIHAPSAPGAQSALSKGN